MSPFVYIVSPLMVLKNPFLLEVEPEPDLPFQCVFWGIVPQVESAGPNVDTPL